MFSFTSFSVNHDWADKTANVQIEFGNYAGVIGVWLNLPGFGLNELTVNHVNTFKSN